MYMLHASKFCFPYCLPPSPPPVPKPNADTPRHAEPPDPFQYRRDLMAKIKDMEARASESRPHEVAYPEHETAAYPSFQGPF